MKVLRNIFTVLLSIILVGLICVMTITFPLKSIFHHQFIGEVVKKEFSTEISRSLSIDEEKVKEAMDTKEVQDFVNQYVDVTMNSFSDEEAFQNISFEKDLETLIRNHKSDLERELDIKISNEELDEAFKNPEFKEITKEYEGVILDMKNQFTGEQKDIMNLYNYVISDSFKIILLGAMAVILLLIGLLQRTYRTLLIVGITALIGGIFSSFLVLGFGTLVNYAIEDLSYLSLNFASMFVYAIGSVIVGIILVSTYAIIKNKKMNQQIREEKSI